MGTETNSRTKAVGVCTILPNNGIRLWNSLRGFPQHPFELNVGLLIININAILKFVNKLNNKD